MRQNRFASAAVRPQSEKEQRRWAGLSEAAIYAGVSSKTMRRWIATGVIRAYRAGPKLVRVDLAEVDRAFAVIPTAGDDAA